MKQVMMGEENNWKKISREKETKEIIRTAFGNQYKSKGNFIKMCIWEKKLKFVNCFLSAR